MKLTKQVIEQTISNVAGEDVLPLIKLLKNKKNVSEFIIAEAMKNEINIVRNMLYRLYHANLVSFTRKKDKKKGWYIYYWTFNSRKIKGLVERLDKQKLVSLKSRLVREKDEHFFICDKGCMRLNFDQAFEFDFKCPECGYIMNSEDNTKKIANIEEEIIKLEKKRKIRNA